MEKKKRAEKVRDRVEVSQMFANEIRAGTPRKVEVPQKRIFLDGIHIGYVADAPGKPVTFLPNVATLVAADFELIDKAVEKAMGDRRPLGYRFTVADVAAHSRGASEALADDDPGDDG